MPAKAGRREWIGLAVIALPCLVYAMDLTVLNLALPALSEDLRPTGAQLLWIVDIYGFFVAGLLITMGTLGRPDRQAPPAPDRLCRLRAGFPARGSLDERRDADRGEGAARRGWCDACSLDALADPQHVRRPARAHACDRGLDHELLDRGGDRPADRWPPARGVLVGLGVPAGAAGDGAAAGRRAAAPARVPRSRRRTARPDQRGDLARGGAGRDLRAEAHGRGRPGHGRGRIYRRRGAGRRGVRPQTAETRGSDDRPAPVPPAGLQRSAGGQHVRLLRQLRDRRVHRPVPPARARAVAIRGRPLDASVRGRLHRRLAPHAVVRAPQPPRLRDGGRGSCSPRPASCCSPR